MRRILILFLLLLLTGCTGGLRFPNATPIATTDERFDPALLPTALPTVTPGLAPVERMQQLGGEAISLDQWHGKHVILNFWASWCWPCREEMPALQAVQDSNEDVVVVGVNFEESEETAADFVEEFGLRFPILLDGDGKLADRLDVVGLPTTFYINAEGRIIGSHVGPLDDAELQRALEALRTQEEARR